ncbi:MAG: hypothetical protein JW863_11615 [Chitinispirillaceae bacterium]|nr:hypothetical protein [Chitinispirillaceae bacterium]
MNKYIIVAILCIPVLAFSQKMAKMGDFQKQSQTAKMECYEVVKPKSATDFMDFKVNALIKRGFQPKTSEKFATDDEICVKETDKRFAYYKNGYFRYVNTAVELFTEGNQVDTAKMKKIAIEIQKQFIPQNKQYKLVSKNEMFVMKPPSLINSLAYVSYRFVRVLKNRLVLGLTDEIEITLGADGELSEFISYEPEYEPVVSNTRAVVKPAAYEKILRKKVKKPKFNVYGDVTLPGFEEMDVDGVTDAYYPLTDGGKKILVPHVAVIMSFIDKDEKISQEAFLSLRAEDWDNMDEADIEVFNESRK